jgi:hypothetical protein
MIYDELCRVLTDYKGNGSGHGASADDLYSMLIKIQNRWEDVITAQNRSANRFPSKEIVAEVRAVYPAGRRVELVSMNDPYAKLKPGDRGTVDCVDDTGSVFVNWDSGSSLAAVFGVDEIRRCDIAKNCKLCGARMVWENPHIPGHFHESSCNIDDWPICHDCMVEHCCSANCLDCEYGKSPDCRFFDIKQHYTDEDFD